MAPARRHRERPEGAPPLLNRQRGVFIGDIMKTRSLAKWAGILITLSVVIVVSSGAQGAAGNRTGSEVREVSADVVRRLVKSCAVVGMGEGHSGSVGVVLRDDTLLVVTGLEARDLFRETLKAQYAERVPDRCVIRFTIE
jgi:hypothetical protein